MDKNKKDRSIPRGSSDLEQSGGLALHSIYQGVAPKEDGENVGAPLSMNALNDMINANKLKAKDRKARITEITDKLFNDNIRESGYKIDYLTFTLDIGTDEEIETDFHKGMGNDINIAINFLSEYFNIKPDDFESCTPVNNFNTGFTIGGFFKVFYNNLSKEVTSPTTKYVAQVTFTGQGCTWLYDLMPDNYKILNIVFENAKNITRIDVCFDSFFKEDIINLDDMIEKLETYQYTSPKRSHKIFKENDSEGNTYSKGFYIGSRTTKDSYFLRCYDKLIQYQVKRQLIPDVAKESGRWERFELSFNGKLSAGIFVQDYLYNSEYINNMDKLFKSVMAKCVTFRDLEYTEKGNIKNAKHKERWPISKFWIDYLNNTPSYRFASISRDPNFTSVLGWISESVMPTIKLLDEILSKHNIDIYNELKQYSAHKGSMSKKHERTVNDSKKLSTDEIVAIMSEFKTGGLKKESSKKKIKRNGEEIG